MRILLNVKTSTATSTPELFPFVVLCGRSFHGRPLSLHCNTNRPDKSQQLPTDSGYDLRFVPSAGQQLLISHVKPVLCLPGNLANLGAEASLALQDLAAHPRSELIRHDASITTLRRWSVSGLRDATLRFPFSRRVLAGNR
jgi:hypothetical protein